MTSQRPSAMPTRSQAQPMSRVEQIQQMLINGVITPQQAALMIQREAQFGSVEAPRPTMPVKRRPLTPSSMPSIGGIGSV